jgi:hypothetical protein
MIYRGGYDNHDNIRSSEGGKLSSTKSTGNLTRTSLLVSGGNVVSTSNRRHSHGAEGNSSTSNQANLTNVPLNSPSVNFGMPDPRAPAFFPSTWN